MTWVVFLFLQQGMENIKLFKMHEKQLRLKQLCKEKGKN